MSPSHLLLSVVLLAGTAAGQEAGLTLEQLRAQRRALAWQPRGIIANNDGCDVLYYPRDQALTVNDFLAMRTTGLAETQVKTIAYCSISSGFSFFTHDTKVGTVLTRQGYDYNNVQPTRRNIAGELIEGGTDCLQAVLDFAHANGLELFWSMRMNDTHDVAHRPDQPYLLYPPLKEEHPEWLVGEVAKATRHGRWSSVNYAVPEIRELAFRYLEEVCTNYNVDGIELDWFRHLCFFPSTANGQVATAAEREAMTGLVRRVRAMTEEVGLRRGRPILVTMRTPDSLEFCHDMGLDLATWLAEGLLDILHTTCYFQLNPWTTSIALGHQHDVPVYPCLSDSRVTGESRFKRRSIEGYRGRAAAAWAAGADGIHLFNYFNPAGAVFRELGDAGQLATKDKLYFVTVRDGNPASWLVNGQQYQTVPILTPAYPASLSPEAPLRTTLQVGDDFTALAAEALPTVTLHLELPALSRPDEVTVAVNGTPVSGGTVADGWLDLPLDPKLLRQGANELAIGLGPDSLTPTDRWTASWSVTDGTLPPAPWELAGGSPRTSVALEAEGLRITDAGEENGDYQFYRFPWGANPAGRSVVEAEVKVLSGSSLLIVSNGAGSERLILWPDRIELWNDRANSSAMDTTTDFHTYRIETDGDQLRVLVDGELRLTSAKPYGGGRYPNQMSFGGANSPMTGDALWRAVRARVDARACRDVVLSVRFPAAP